MQTEVGAILNGKVTGITKYGVFVELETGKTGMVHISEVAAVYVKEIRDFVDMGQEVKVKVLSIAEDGKIALSMKQSQPLAAAAPRMVNRQNGSRPSPQRSGGDSFDDMLSRFMATSDEKMTDLRRINGERRTSRKGNK